MAPIDPWQNSTPDFGALAFCTTNIEDFRTPLMSTSSTISSTYSSHNRSSRWTSSKVKVMQVIKVDQLEDTNYERLTWAKLHSGLKPKNENDLWGKTTFDRRWPLTEDDLWWNTTFVGRQTLTEDDLWRKTTLDRGHPLTKDDVWWKTAFDGRWKDPIYQKELNYPF